MGAYLLFIFIILILQFKKQSKVIVNIMMIILLVFASLRGNGDGDYFAYLRYSQYIQSYSDVTNNNFPMEIGFRIIAYVVNFIGVNSQYVIITMNFIIIIILRRTMIKYSANPKLSILLYIPFFFQYDMHATRTAVAIAITTLSYEYLINREFFKYSLVVLAAMTFHKTAIILLPIYFIFNIKIDLKRSITCIIVAIIISKLNFIYFLIYIMDNIGLSSYAFKIREYILSEYGYHFSLLDPRLIIFVIILILALCNEVKIKTLLGKEEFNFFQVSYKFIFYSIIIMILMSSMTILVTRLSAYTRIAYIILIPFILEKFKNKREYLLYNYIVYVTAFLYIGVAVYKFYYIKNIAYKVFFLQ